MNVRGIIYFSRLKRHDVKSVVSRRRYELLYNVHSYLIKRTTVLLMSKCLTMECRI